MASNVTPHIGYLKELGLDFGIGPTSTMQWILEHVHVYSGLPWFGSIALTTIAIRLMLFKLYLNSADTAGRLAVIAPLLEPMKAKMQAAQASRDPAAVQQCVDEARAMYRSANIRVSYTFLPILFQVPFAIGSFRLLRHMAQVLVPGLDDGGFLWVYDLTVSDPLYILPVVTSAIMYYTMKVSRCMSCSNCFC